MGYRNYFYICDKEKLADFLTKSHEDQVKLTFSDDPDDLQIALDDPGLNPYDVMEYLNGKDVFECGKYFDSSVAKKICEGGVDLSTEDNEFFIIKPEGLITCAEFYRDECIKDYDKIVKSFDLSDEEIEEDKDTYLYGRPNYKNLFLYKLRDLQNDVLNSNKDSIYNITNSWKYEYLMFELIHIYKIVDWTKYDLVWMGW